MTGLATMGACMVGVAAAAVRVAVVAKRRCERDLVDRHLLRAGR
jgi:hypothetical protein